MKTAYHIYHNWRARRDHGTLHYSSCRFCRNGLGAQRNTRPGRNGVWIGPFATRQFAIAYLDRFQPSSLCPVCQP